MTIEMRETGDVHCYEQCKDCKVQINCSKRTAAKDQLTVKYCEKYWMNECESIWYTVVFTGRNCTVWVETPLSDCLRGRKGSMCALCARCDITKSHFSEVFF